VCHYAINYLPNANSHLPNFTLNCEIVCKFCLSLIDKNHKYYRIYYLWNSSRILEYSR
jgi:hypothetical protein